MKIKIFYSVLLIIIPFILFSQEQIDLLILNKNYNQALIEINNIIYKNPSAELYLKKGIVQQNLQDYQQALQSYTSGLQYDPKYTELLEQSAECLAILGNNPDAISYYKQAFELDTNNLVTAAKLGRVYINTKDYKNAYNIFSRIYANDSTNVYWNKQLAYCSFRIFKREQAVYLYEKVLEANPRDYGTYSNLIHAYNWKKQGNEIMATIDKGLQQFPGDSELIFERASFFFRTKRYGPAMLQFEKYMDAGGKLPYETMMNYGISAYFAEYTNKALEIFNDLFRMNPNDAIVMYYQSLCYKNLKNFEESEKLMQWAIESSTPNYVSEMYHHLGQILGQQRKFEESVVALEKAYELNPQKHEILFEIATTYEEFNSNKTMALNYYRIYLKEAGEEGKNIIYALDRIEKIKEDLFFEE
ncbi:MAG: tetratricopeptide repeat protein [Bacteroidota bacterium]